MVPGACGSLWGALTLTDEVASIRDTSPTSTRRGTTVTAVPATQRNLALAMSTGAFALCFAAWTMLGTLATSLSSHGLLTLDPRALSWLIAAPIASGALLRIPLGHLADAVGGRVTWTLVLGLCAIAQLATAATHGYFQLLMAGFPLGLAGASFAVGVSYVSRWFPTEKRGLALGIFGLGNVGAALSAVFVPAWLSWLMGRGAHTEMWRGVPLVYAGFLACAAALFWRFAPDPPRPVHAAVRATALAIVRCVSAWELAALYFVLFGGSIALCGWLVPLCVGRYGLSPTAAGGLATAFIVPAAALRPVGGWLADRHGANAVLRGVVVTTVLVCLTLAWVGLSGAPTEMFAGLLIALGGLVAVGNAAVYKAVADTFPTRAGAAGGFVGAVGGLGGVACAPLFGHLQASTGHWESCWFAFAAAVAACLALPRLYGRSHLAARVRRLWIPQSPPTHCPRSPAPPSFLWRPRIRVHSSWTADHGQRRPAPARVPTVVSAIASR